MAFVMDDDFAWVLQEFGEPDLSTSVKTEDVKRCKNKLPSRLIEYWLEFGFCRFSNGLLWLTNPGDYEDAVNAWLPHDAAKSNNYNIIARSAFVYLYVWGEKSDYIYQIRSGKGYVSLKDGEEEDIRKGSSNAAILTFFSILDRPTLDLEDVDAEASIFDYAVETYGPLAEDEMLALEPELFMVGEQTYQNVRKVNTHVQLDILSNVASKNVLDIHGLTKRALS